MIVDSNQESNAAIWRRRFILINIIRIIASLLVLLGLLVWQSDVIVAGGSALGLVLMLIGLIGSFGLPQWLAHRWSSRK